ncbi:MAG: o-succinylbenzoate synthase [Muribaculaceae bacterium]|nr:o-succinylbenzoate synthase [Muribaculaceae bacterium]MDE6027605.1 o-succinylbenzoate synthase [Muribaculaceae bacterium]
MRLQFAPYTLQFKNPAGTSRGILTSKLTAFLRIFDEKDPSRYGIGEAAIFPGLSPEADERYFYKMVELVTNIKLGLPTDLSHFPSIQSGFEQAIRDFASGGRGLYFDSPFIRGEKHIDINGLVWMGNYDEMLDRLETKIKEGFRCIKIKIGAIEWEKEKELIAFIRTHFDRSKVEIRVDANGGFNMDTIRQVLRKLADLDVHSIEQPIKAGTPELMASLCKDSPVPIALDEELIGKFSEEDKKRTLSQIVPQYIVLKPSLVGGFSGSQEWIDLAREQGIGWWVTSALESNIGLNAIAQWVATLDTRMTQGLGTGNLYTNNFTSPIYLEGDKLSYDPSVSLSKDEIDKLDWRD